MIPAENCNNSPAFLHPEKTIPGKNASESARNRDAEIKDTVRFFKGVHLVQFQA